MNPSLPNWDELESAGRFSASPGADDTGKYDLVRAVGRGGMGEVWEAVDRTLQRRVAVKFVRGRDDEDEKRFLREAQVVAKLKHANIVPIYEIGSSGGRSFLAMQFVDGVTIDRARLNLPRLVTAIRDIAVALDYAHQQGVVHRDIKPGNIMMEGDKAFLMDFGLARSMKVDSSISKSGEILGTPAFMSPEQARGQSKLVDAQSDVYSLGAALYALLTGRPPYGLQTEDDAVALLLRVMNDEPPPPRSVTPSIPRQVETIVLKAMERDRSRRYASAMEFARDLQRYLDGEPILATRPSLAYRAMKRLAKHRVAAAAVAVAAVLGVYALYQAGVRAGERADDRRSFEEADKETDLVRKLAGYQKAMRHVPEAKAKAQETQRLLDERKRMAEEDLRWTSAYQSGLELWSKAVQYVRGGRHDEARTASDEARGWFEQAVAIRERAAAHHMIGRCWQVRGDVVKTTESLRRAVAADPDYAVARIDLAKILLSRYAKARLPRIAHKDGTITVARLPAETAPQKSQREEAMSHIDRLKGGALPAEQGSILDGLLCLGQGEPARAAELLGQYVSKESWDAEALHLQGLAYYLTARVADAERVFAEALRMTPDVEMMLLLADMRFLQKKYAQTIEDCTRILQISPDNPKALVYRGRARENSGDNEGAWNDINRAAQVGGFAEAHYQRAVMRLQRRADEKGAMEDYNRAIELDPKFDVAYCFRGYLKRRQEKYDDALGDFNKALELNPDLVAAYVGRGETYFLLEKDKEAAADYDRALALAPDDDHIYLLRALLRRETGDLRGALADMNEALKRLKDDPKVFFDRATLHIQMEQYESAKEDLMQVLKLNPGHVPSYQNRAKINEMLAARVSPPDHRLLEEAKRDYEKCVDLSGPGWKERASVRLRIQQIQKILEREY